jgi:hypothetical protein
MTPSAYQVFSMSMSSNDGQPWGLLQWGFTVLSTALVSSGAFVWRFLIRMERLESNHVRQRDELEEIRSANDASMLRLAERLGQLHEDHFRLREAVGAMPTRSDLRDLEERLTLRLSALSDRIDRVIDA